MRYESSEAVRLDGYDMRSNMREASASPSFDVYEGGGLDARVRQGVTHQFLVKLVRVALVAAAICALGFAPCCDLDGDRLSSPGKRVPREPDRRCHGPLQRPQGVEVGAVERVAHRAHRDAELRYGPRGPRGHLFDGILL
jgi:hypothetical protein